MLPLTKMEEIRLSRDCPAITIPSGTEITLPENTEVVITQSLGGSYTVRAPGGLFRIPSEHTDALGIEVKKTGTDNHPDDSKPQVPADEQTIWEALKSVFDPEIPVNIVDLGLVYDLVIKEEEDKRVVYVKMTLTAPGCGMGPVIAQDAQDRIMALEGIHDASVEVIWDPPWHQSMISAEGKKILGLG